MIVECCINNLNQIDDESTIKRIKSYIRLSDGQLHLDVKKKYCVYGILFRDNTPWYYLCLHENNEYPKPYPADLFKIIDDNIPAYWKLVYKNIRGQLITELVIPEWAEDDMFYENLVDGAKRETAIFHAEKEKARI